MSLLVSARFLVNERVMRGPEEFVDAEFVFIMLGA